jgi:hypothetical protein
MYNYSVKCNQKAQFDLGLDAAKLKKMQFSKVVAYTCRSGKANKKKILLKVI